MYWCLGRCSLYPLDIWCNRCIGVWADVVCIPWTYGVTDVLGVWADVHYSLNPMDISITDVNLQTKHVLQYEPPGPTVHVLGKGGRVVWTSNGHGIAQYTLLS